MGRHAKPKEGNGALTRAATVTATTGALLVGPSLLPTTASADSPNVDWDKVAECESSNDWDANTGNSFYGGLQFTKSTWNEFGGNKYADRADHATREQQIEIAENVLDGQGIRAWPVCGPKGLTGETRSERTSPAPATTTAPRTTTQVPRTAEQPSAPTTERLPTGERVGQTYTVRSGDTLSEISFARGLNWVQVAAFNNMANPHLIFPGDVIKFGTQGSVQIQPQSSSRPSVTVEPQGKVTVTPTPTPRAAEQRSEPRTEATTPRATATARVETAASQSSAQSDVGAKIVANARTYFGTPYVYGGNTRQGLDCSALTQRAYKAAGISIPRVSNDQLNASTRITASQARSGDLVFYRNDNGRAYHVGIFIGQGRMIDASKPGTVVDVRKIADLNTVYGRIR